MGRLWTGAALAVTLLVTPLWAQVRGGRSFASGGRFGSLHGGGFRGPVRGPLFGGGFGHRPGFFFRGGPFFYGHRSRFFFGASFGSPFYYPYYGYAAYPYSYPVVVETPPAYYPEQYQEQGNLRRDIDVLTGKVDRLQQDVESRMPAPRPRSTTQQEETPHPTTVLVFRDNHTREVQNYAIVGETVWIFDEKKAEKIALSDLDLDATHRVNDQRGVDFYLPQ